ncbi:tRNA (pseudouridine(54)-N(1))-methyltransferase TrmY [Methanopyrus sp.]
MREFLVLFNHAPTSPDRIRLKDLPGSGRFDLVCRVTTQSLLYSHGVRTDTVVHLLLRGPNDPPKTITVTGRRVRRLYPDERTTAIHLRRALAADPDTEPHPGIFVRRADLQDLLDEMKGAKLYYMSEDGRDLEEVEPGPDAVFVLGDHEGPTPEQDRLLRRRADAVISVGPIPYHSDQCIVILHRYLDVKRPPEYAHSVSNVM